MGQVQQAIVLEDVLEELFSFLPKMSFDEDGPEYPVTFGYGDNIELNLFLKNREEQDVYPLVWMLYPNKEEHQKNRLISERTTFIVAVLTNQSMENHERMQLTYGKVLMPLLHNMRLLFRGSNVTTTGHKHEGYEVVKYPNFSETDIRSKTGTIAIWDALKVVVNLEIIQGCIKPVKFFK